MLDLEQDLEVDQICSRDDKTFLCALLAIQPILIRRMLSVAGANAGDSGATALSAATSLAGGSRYKEFYEMLLR